MQNELSVIQNAQSGDLNAFRILVEEHQELVYTFAYNLTGQHHDAEDLSQEVFIRVFRSIDKFRHEAKFSSWLYRITLNTHISQLRNKNMKIWKRRSSLEENSSHNNLVIPLSDSNNPEQSASHHELQQHLQNALKKLSPKERAVFCLKHFEGFKLKEISEILHISIGTVKSHLFRAIKKLQSELSFYSPAGKEGSHA